MSSNRVGGPTPPEKGSETKNPIQQRQKKVDKIEKVGEVDPDQSRARRFRQALEDAEQQFEDAKKMGNTNPSPFETAFYTSDTPRGAAPGPLLGMGQESVSPDSVINPNYTAPPDVSAAPPPLDEDPDNFPLPQSTDFWADADAPPDQPLPPKTFQESQGNPQMGKRDASEQGAQKKPGALPKGVAKPSDKKEPPPFFNAKPTKGMDKVDDLDETLFDLDEDDGEGTIPLPKKGSSKPHLGETKDTGRSFEKETPKPFQTEDKKGAPVSRELSKGETKGTNERTQPAEKGTVKGTTSRVTPERARKEAEVRAQGIRAKVTSEKEHENRPIDISAPSVPPLPPEVIPVALTAAQQASPYIRGETLSLFYQMVGTIYVMQAPPGVSRTEILLNAPSFANSRFYGATILIEKYATAPDALNIRLTGSNEAVTAFNQNIPSLMAAFQNGNFAFRVNRIDTAYQTDKPVFRRKERGDERGSGFDQSKK